MEGGRKYGIATRSSYAISASENKPWAAEIKPCTLQQAVSESEIGLQRWFGYWGIKNIR
jgi:hypothetical protein